MECRDIRSPRITEFTIYLIREQEQIIFLYDITNLIHFLLCVQITGRIIRVTDQDRFGTRSDQLLKPFHRRKSKAFIDSRRNCFDHSSTGNGKRHIVCIRRFGNNNFIPRIQTSHKRKEYSFRASGSDDYIFNIDIDIEFRIIFNQFLTETTNSLTRRIFQYFTVNTAHGLHRDLGSR